MHMECDAGCYRKPLTVNRCSWVNCHGIGWTGLYDSVNYSACNRSGFHEMRGHRVEVCCVPIRQRIVEGSVGRAARAWVVTRGSEIGIDGHATTQLQIH